MAAGPLHKRRLARKAAKAAERQKIKVKTKYMGAGDWPTDTDFDFQVKRGGRVRSFGRITYRKQHKPPHLDIPYIAPVLSPSKKEQAARAGGGIQAIHTVAKGKVHTTGELKEVVAHLKKRFPKAEYLVGGRITGMHGEYMTRPGPAKYTVHRPTGMTREISNIIKMPTLKRVAGILKKKATKGLLSIGALTAAMKEK